MYGKIFLLSTCWGFGRERDRGARCILGTRLSACDHKVHGARVEKTWRTNWPRNVFMFLLFTQTQRIFRTSFVYEAGLTDPLEIIPEVNI